LIVATGINSLSTYEKRRQASLFSSEKKAVIWVTQEERQEKKISKNLSLRKRKKERRSGRRKNLPDSKDSSPDRLV
jgi:hypothetical protein